MKFFLDTANIDEIRHFNETGLVDGVTTNPSLIAKSGRDFKETIHELCEIVHGPVSAEVVATDYEAMVAQGRTLAKISDKVAVKVPLTEAGIRTCYTLSQEGIKVNVTLCFTSAQALLAAKAGATFISPFVGRLDDISYDGMELISEIVDVYNNYEDIHTEVLVASIRHPRHVMDSARMGAHVATIPPKIFGSLFKHPLTDKGLAAFLKDWEETNQII